MIFCIGIILILILFFFYVETRCTLTGGGRRRHKKGRRMSGSSPLHSKMIELGLTDKETTELITKIDNILKQHTDNEFIITIKKDNILNNLNKENIRLLYDDITTLKDIAELEDDVQDIRKQTASEVEACTLYECPRCGAKKHTYHEVQQRSLDEPTNIKCNCLQCGFKWDQE